MGSIYELAELRKNLISFEEDAIYISEHSFKRLKERVGWNRKTAKRMMKRVYEQGIRPDDLKGYQSIWISQRADKFRDFDEIVLYGMHAYLFRERVLITVFHIPSRGTCLKMVS